jgi:hypothetical protein
MKLVVTHTCGKTPASSPSPSPTPAALPPGSGTSDPGGPPGVMTMVDWRYAMAPQTYTLRCNKDGINLAWSGGFHNVYIDGVDDCQTRASGTEPVPAAGAGSYSWVPKAAGTYYVKCTVGGPRRCARQRCSWQRPWWACAPHGSPSRRVLMPLTPPPHAQVGSHCSAGAMKIKVVVTC